MEKITFRPLSLTPCHPYCELRFHLLDAALPVGRAPSQRLCVLLRICSDCATPQLCATGSRVGGSGFFQFGTRAFTPSAFGSSAHDLPCSYAQYRCYKTFRPLSLTPCHPYCELRFHLLDAALPVGRTPSQRLCVLLRICSDHSGATRTGHSLARHRRQFRSCLWWKVAARIFGASHRFLHVGSWSRWFGAPLLWMSSGLRHDLS